MRELSPRTDEKKAFDMKTAGFVAILTTLFAAVPAASVQLVGCSVNASAPQGITYCAFSSGIERIDFHVEGWCKDNCTGDRWEATGLSRTATGQCDFCGASVGCMGCVRDINLTKLEYYATATNRVFKSYACVQLSQQESKITCDCPYCSDPGPTPNSPILISPGDNHYELSSATDGVQFDLDMDGVPELTAWTAAGSDEAFLVLDRNGNGQIDDYREVFGNHTPQFPSDEPNGWRALAVWDDSLNGGNEDGLIDAADDIFYSLQLWVDRNHNGFSEPDELSDLTEAGIAYLDLDFKKSERKDAFGNTFRFWAKVGTEKGRVVVAWDVFFTRE